MAESVLDASFRWAKQADAPELCALVESAYRGDVSRDGWTTEADLLEGQRTDAAMMEATLNAPNSHILLFDQGEGIQACAHLQRTPEHTYFGMFSVSPNAQGLGLGNRMLAEAERIAHVDWQSTVMHMTVIAQRAELIAWYARRGYQQTGEQKPFPYGDERFGVPLRDDLYFVVLEKNLAT